MFVLRLFVSHINETSGGGHVDVSPWNSAAVHSRSHIYLSAETNVLTSVHEERNSKSVKEHLHEAAIFLKIDLSSL